MIQTRCITLFGEINDQTATECIAKLLFLEKIGPGEPITLHIDSPGGLITASLAIIGTMDNLTSPVHTVCKGVAGGVAAVIVAHGHRGARASIADGRFHFSPTIANPNGKHLETHVTRIHQVLIEHLAEDTRKHEAEIASWFRDSSEFTAPQALEVGIIDRLI